VTTAIRPAAPRHTADITAMIRAPAEFERDPEQGAATEAQVSATLFGPFQAPTVTSPKSRAASPPRRCGVRGTPVVRVAPGLPAWRDARCCRGRRGRGKPRRESTAYLLPGSRLAELAGPR
jgi:hypothetical protein